LVSGFDQTGTHLYQTEPSGNYYSFKAIAIGARSQSARTYLEKTYGTFDDLGEAELIKHALIALRGTTGDNVDLTSKNTSVSVVSKDGYKVYEDEDVAKWVDLVKQEKKLDDDKRDDDVMETIQ
jgi:20S proteasome subunit alpha 6